MISGLYLLTSTLLLAAASSCKNTEMKIVQVTGPYSLGEGPHWDITEQVLYFVDIDGQKIMCYNPATGKTTEAYIEGGPVSLVVPVAGKKNTFIATRGIDIIEVTWDPKSDNSKPEFRILSTINEDRNKTKFNDGKIDPAGCLWAGTMSRTNPNGNVIDNVGSLYRFDADGTANVMIQPVSVSNGLCWSNDNRTFYYNDSPKRKVTAYNYDISTGNISNGRVIFSLPPTDSKNSDIVDGMTIDRDGYLWIAVPDSGQVIQIDPNTGRQLRAVTLPVKFVTSVAFGGTNLDVLYVTSAQIGMTDEELKKSPASGAVFAVHGLGTVGTPMYNAKL